MNESITKRLQELLKDALKEINMLKEETVKELAYRQLLAEAEQLIDFLCPNSLCLAGMISYETVQKIEAWKEAKDNM